MKSCVNADKKMTAESTAAICIDYHFISIEMKGKTKESILFNIKSSRPVAHSSIHI